MKIGIDCRLWGETGVGRYTRNLVGKLIEIDSSNSFILFCLKKDVVFLEKVVSDNKNFKVVIADIRWHSITEQFIFPFILYKEKLDLMHFTYFSVPVFYLKKYIVTIHDLIIHHFLTGRASTHKYLIYLIKRQIYLFIFWFSAKRASKIIAVSESTKKEIVQHLGILNGKIVVAHEGFEEFEKYGKISLEKKLVNYFLYVGNAYPHKNLDNLISAFKIFKKKYKDVSLVLVGKHDFFYERYKKANFEEGLFFWGGVSDKELVFLYKNAIALVVPSLMEGFSLPPIEAMSLGCVVLASDIPSHREICNNAAIYFSPENPDEIFKKMEFCFRNNRMLSSYRAKAAINLKRFSWKKMAEITLETYESCNSIRSNKQTGRS